MPPFSCQPGGRLLMRLVSSLFMALARCSQAQLFSVQSDEASAAEPAAQSDDSAADRYADIRATLDGPAPVGAFRHCPPRLEWPWIDFKFEPHPHTFVALENEPVAQQLATQHQRHLRQAWCMLPYSCMKAQRILHGVCCMLRVAYCMSVASSSGRRRCAKLRRAVRAGGA